MQLPWYDTISTVIKNTYPRVQQQQWCRVKWLRIASSPIGFSSNFRQQSSKQNSISMTILPSKCKIKSNFNYSAELFFLLFSINKNSKLKTMLAIIHSKLLVGIGWYGNLILFFKSVSLIDNLFFNLCINYSWSIQ